MLVALAGESQYVQLDVVQLLELEALAGGLQLLGRPGEVHGAECLRQRHQTQLSHQEGRKRLGAVGYAGVGEGVLHPPAQRSLRKLALTRPVCERVYGEEG